MSRLRLTERSWRRKEFLRNFPDTLHGRLSLTFFLFPVIIFHMSEIEKLEIKISYLEKENAELNETIIDMDKRLGVLMAQFEEMKKKVKDLIDNNGEERENRRPPHY